MQHQLTGVQPKRINTDKGVFESCSVYYYIDLEAMSFDHMKAFGELLPVIIYGKKYFDLAMFIHEMRIKMTSGGDDFKKTFFDVATNLTNFDQYLLDNAGEFLDQYMDDVLRFCALFICTKEEDRTKLSSIETEIKLTNWKKDMHIPDFFLLAKSQVPRFKELLQTLSMEATNNGGRLIPETKLPETRQKGQQD